MKEGGKIIMVSNEKCLDENIEGSFRILKFNLSEVDTDKVKDFLSVEEKRVFLDKLAGVNTVLDRIYFRG
jgi:hypothetical protein